MMPKTHYEVRAGNSKNAQIDSLHTSLAGAQHRIQQLIRQARFSRVAVYRVDDRLGESLVMERSAGVELPGERPRMAAPVSESVVCRSVWEVYAPPSRRVIGRVLREWCEDEVRVASELLHDRLLLRQILEEEPLFHQALSILGMAQARHAHSSPTQRIAELEQLFQEVFRLSEENDQLAPFARDLLENRLDMLAATLPVRVAPAEVDRVVSYAFGALLQPARSWPGKVMTLCELLHGAVSPAGAGLVDGVLAEVVESAASIRSLLGPTRDLAGGLAMLASVCQGRLMPSRTVTEALIQLNDVMATHELPETVATLLERVAIALDGCAPLTRGDRVADQAALLQLLTLLTEGGSLAGGPMMAAAMTRRAKMVFGTRFEDLSFEEAVTALIQVLPSTPARLSFLFDLLDSRMGMVNRLPLTRLAAGFLEQLDPVPEAEGTALFEAGMQRIHNRRLPPELVQRLERLLQRLSHSFVPVGAYG